MQARPDRRSRGARCRGGVPGLALALAFSAVPALADTDDELSVTPYRPSVSTPAALSAPGWLEVEGGLQHNHVDHASRDSVPVTLKLAFTADWGIRVGADAWARIRDDSRGQVSGYGDTGVVLKRRFAVDDASAFGLEAGALLPTSHHGVGIGSGKADYGVNAIYSTDFASSWHTDLNLQPTRVGEIEPDTGRTLWLAAASLSYAVDDKWTLIGEVSGSHRRGITNNSQLLLAASYNVSKQLVLDAGAARNLLRGSPGWSAFTGFTWLAARIF